MLLDYRSRPRLLLSILLPLLVMSSPDAPRPVAIVTGGTRGIGSGIASALNDAGFDLLLTYNTNKDAADKFAASQSCKVECVGGDISLPETRDEVFACLESKFPDQPLKVMVHNAGQYVGITSDNSDGLTDKPLQFGDGSLVQEDGTVNFDTMHYYQRMYGEAFVDLCERSLLRMTEGGSIVGLSSPGVTAYLYGAGPMYSMPGSGKCLMEYSMRIYALQAAARNINVNVVVPGITITEAWSRLFKKRGTDVDMHTLAETKVPMKKALVPRDIGNVVAFLTSDAGRFVTGTVVPIDGGLHLKR